MKLVIIFLSLIIYANATNVLVSSYNINHKEILNYDDLSIISTTKKIRHNTFDKEKLLKTTYQAKHYIIKGTPIYDKDVQIARKHRISYDFGNMVIERSGKIVGENKRYIKIKNTDGSIEKIYKNGQVR